MSSILPPSPNPPPTPSSSSIGSNKVKRKRLAKACDACHKSKRRCDGTAPCANCEFAGKVCVYTDASGHHIPPPLERAGPTSGAPYPDQLSHDFIQTEQKKRKATQAPPLVIDHRFTSAADGAAGSAKPAQSAISDTQSPSEHPSASPQDVGIDSVIAHELVNLFFLHLHPYNLAFHRPTFLNDLSAGRVPLYLLCAVLALAAPLSTLPRVKTTPRHCAGERFARAAKEMILDPGGGLRVRPCLEVAQALTLITMHDCIGRQTGRRTDYYQHIALDILVEGGVRSYDCSPGTRGSMSREDWTRREVARRLFYLIYMIELLASVWTRRPLSHRERDLRIFLPIDEPTFELTTMDGSIPREFLLPLVPPHGGKSQASPFGFLVRVVAVYTRISDNLFAKKHDKNEGGTSLHRDIALPPTVVDIVSDGEDALRTWEQSLPNYMAFNEQNLQVHVATLQSGASVAGWCYFYMHAIAECCVLALQEAIELDRAHDRQQSSADTRHRALDNLKIILKSLGQQGRTSIMMGNILEAGAKHGILGSSTHPDAEIVTWFSDWEDLWGINLDQLTSVEFRRSWVPDYPQDHLTSTARPLPRVDRLFTGRSYDSRTAIESDDATRVASPPGEPPGAWSSARDPGEYYQPTRLPPLRPPTDSSSPSVSMRPIRSRNSADTGRQLVSPLERWQPHLGPQGRSHSHPSSASAKASSHECQNSAHDPNGTSESRSRLESYQLPPPNFASDGGDGRRVKPEGLALPSIRDVGLFRDDVSESSYTRDVSRSGPSPGSTERQLGPASS